MDYSIAGARPLVRADARSIAYVAALSLVAAYFLAWPLWRAQFLVEIWFTESWNAYWQDAAAYGRPIYPDPVGLTGNNYPPLSFYVVGALGKLLNVDNLYVGRWLSFAAVAALGLEIFACVRILAPGRLGAIVAAIWYLAIMARNSTIYAGANDPQLVGLAIMGAGLTWLLSRIERDASPIPALLIMVVGGFWKHNNVAIPLASLTWLFMLRSRFSVHALRVSIEAVIVGLAVCVVIFGPNFLPNMLAPRQYAWSNVIGNLGHLQWCALALLIWASWAASDRRSRPARFTALQIGIALTACIVQWLGHGIFGNAEFDLIFAAAIGVGVTFNRIGKCWLAKWLSPDRCRDLMVVALLLRLLVADRQETALLMLSADFHSMTPNALC